MDQQMRTLQKKRTANFREDETRLLIQLWGSPAVQNKLFLTHRKAPVMRLLAANMQQRGFYRTPEEIKTRIRNLKCLYHRIKRTIGTGTGIGTVDPDWPHYKAMDDILSKQYPRKETSRIMEEMLDGKGEHHFDDIQIKQEIDDIDVDDNDSWATNETNSEYEDDHDGGSGTNNCDSASDRLSVDLSVVENVRHHSTTPTSISSPPTTTTPISSTTTPRKETVVIQSNTNPHPHLLQHLQLTPRPPPSLKPAPILTTKQPPQLIHSFPTKKITVATSQPGQINLQTLKAVTTATTVGQKLPTILPAFTVPNSGGMVTTTQNQINKNIPFPLLILNGPQLQTAASDKSNMSAQAILNSPLTGLTAAKRPDSEVSDLLKELVHVQKQSLDMQRVALEVEKQRLEFDRLIGTQLVTLIPMLGGLLQRIAYPGNQELDLHINTKGHGAKRKRSPSEEDADILKDSKILKSMLEEGIKKYMMQDDEKDAIVSCDAKKLNKETIEPIPDDENRVRIIVENGYKAKTDDNRNEIIDADADTEDDEEENQRPKTPKKNCDKAAPEK